MSINIMVALESWDRNAIAVPIILTPTCPLLAGILINQHDCHFIILTGEGKKATL
jgi:hypothetical protein